MSLFHTDAPWFTSGSPMTEEYLASNTYFNGSQLPYPGMLGRITEFDVGTIGVPNLCRFQLVKAASGVTPAAGAVLYWASKAAFTVTTVATSGNLAGICPVLMTAAASGFWMIKHGDRNVLFVDSPTVTVAAGLPVVASDTDAKADALGNTEGQGTFPLIGVALGAQDGTTKLANVRINIPDTF